MILDRDTLAEAGATLHLPPGSEDPAAWRFRVGRVAHDSRKVEPGDLFVGIPAAGRNGSDFHPQAAERGAAFLLLDRLPDPLRLPTAVSPDPMASLVSLARRSRSRMTGAVVSLTGSSGKTSTKEMTAAILSSAGSVHATRGNYNNLLGVAITLVECPSDVASAVLEVGTSAPGEIAPLADLVRPSIGILTIVGASHLEALGDPDGVYAEKIELIRRLVPPRRAVLNLDDPRIRRFTPSADMEVCWYGTGEGADLRGEDYRADGAGAVFLARPRGGAPVTVRLPVPGRHMMMNALAALAAARFAGVPLEAGAAALAAGFRPVPGRLHVRPARGGVTLVDDSYNANPESLRAALVTARDLPCAGRRVAALGDMLELGPAGPDLHRAAGRLAAELGFDRLIAVGPLMAYAAAAALEAGMPPAAVERFATSAEAAAALAPLAPGDLLLVKGSHGMKMERLVEAL